MFETRIAHQGVLCLLLLASSAAAQPAPSSERAANELAMLPAGGGHAPAVGSQPSPAPLAIIGVKNALDGRWQDSGTALFAIGETVDVLLTKDGLNTLRTRAGADAFGLLLEGRFLKDVAWHSVGPDELTFHLQRTTENQALWDELLGGHVLDRHRVRLELGLANGTALTGAQSFTLTFRGLRSPKGVWICIAAAVFLLLTVVLAKKTTMLRDASGPGANITWSLGRVQMAFWFANVILAFLLIWAVTGATPEVTASVLALLGIGAGTALGASVIDAAKDAVRAKAAGASAPPAVAPSPVKSDGFLLDLLMDEDSISFHRYQMAIWTVVLGCVFWGSVWHRFAMPDFDATFLALQGITAGTYLGFKLPGAAPSAASA